MESRIETKYHANGELQRFQIIEGFDWKTVNFFSPGFDKRAITEIARLYRTNIIAKNPSLYGTIAFFCVCEDTKGLYPMRSTYGTCFSNNVAASIYLNEQVKRGTIKWEGSFTIDDEQASAFLSFLTQENLIEVVEGEGTGLMFVPIHQKMGFLSQARNTSCVVNSHFFLMDPTDLDSPYCVLGTPHGLALKDGVVLNPPLNHREVFLVTLEGKTQVTHVEITDLTVEIDGVRYVHGHNAFFHFRPEERKTPMHDGMDVIITENRVVAIKEGGDSVIPMAGFVLSITDACAINSTEVMYHGLEQYCFGIQVGPSMIENFSMVESLKCPFFVTGRDTVPYPSTVYPLPFETARAARIALGSNAKSASVLIWAEGAGKLQFNPEEDSTGCSLLELAQFCASQGYKDIVNLDGGGSAQILYKGMKQLRIADRYKITNLEAERPVPMGITIQ